ncbi:hypothetical protein ACQCU1_02735 [Sutcliffiella horikoshii]|uniref:hypothetical protein n=1 Tax=Sutcliffiella horikoshii TaxID=79883 RepID=UPI003CE99EA1
MSEEKLDIAKRYSIEIQKIANKLRDLENGRIYELTGSRMDGSIATNATQLRKMIVELLSKIDNQEESVTDIFADLFESKK